ncbi:MAG: class I SAM-dependent methyltransferase [Aristaeellaceae bacterium]
MHITLEKNLFGTILDIGGGGEGIIGRIYGEQVTAIDICPEELEESQAVCHKLVMDATAMTFPDSSFDHVTSFYTLMYMTAEQQCAALREAYRVLNTGGMLHVWDAAFPAPYPEPYLAELSIDAAGMPVHTTYGVVKCDGQSADGIAVMAKAAGFMLVGYTEQEKHFFLRFAKQPC